MVISLYQAQLLFLGSGFKDENLQICLFVVNFEV